MMDTNNLKIKAYNYIKNKIISGVYPPNQKIEESEISNELNFSRTPIREAINTLKDEGWITIIPRKGIFVSEISLKDINDIFQVRETIEPIILRLAFENLNNIFLKFEKILLQKVQKYISGEGNWLEIEQKAEGAAHFFLDNTREKIFVPLKDNQLIKLLKVDPTSELEKVMQKANETQRDEIAEFAINNKILDIEKNKIIKKYTERDVINTVKLLEASKEE